MTERLISRRGADGPEGTAAEAVAVIHGLGNARIGVQLLALRLAAAGFASTSIGYPSRRLPLTEAVARVGRSVEALAARHGTVHLVGHSLGGVIAACLAAGRPASQIGRVVMIGAPMRGSALAAWSRQVAPLRDFLGPVLGELAEPTGPRPVSGRIAAIAGISGSRRLGREVGLLGPHDGKVTLRSAWAGAGHRAAVPVTHAMLPYSRQVAGLTIHFLRQGRFPEPAERAA